MVACIFFLCVCARVFVCVCVFVRLCVSMSEQVHPGGAAAELGAKVGWVLKSIDGESVAQLGGNKAIAVLSEKAKNLPERAP